MSLKQNNIAFLKKIYEEVGHNGNQFVPIKDIGNKIGIEDINNIQNIVNNLKVMGYIRVDREQGNVGATGVRITSSGINKMEKLKKPIKYFVIKHWKFLSLIAVALVTAIMQLML